MPHLEIMHLTGDVERRELSKKQPLSIGSHASNDVVIDEEGIELMHCRIAWNKDGYEAVAAGTEGLDVNGNIVKRAKLKSGDVLRFGTIDLRFRDGEAVAKGEPKSDVPRFQDDVPKLKDVDFPPSFPPKESKPEKRSESKSRKPVSEEASWDALEALAAESRSEMPASEPDEEGSRPSRRGTGRGGAPTRQGAPAEKPSRGELRGRKEESEAASWDALEALAAESRADMPAAEQEDDAPAPPSSRGRPRPESEPASHSHAPAPAASAVAVAEPPPARAGSAVDPAMTNRLRQTLRRQQRRPGQEDTARSLLVWGLGGGAAILLLVAATFWLMISRQTVEDAFNEGKSLYEGGQYANAITSLTSFIAAYPRDKLAIEARLMRGMAELDVAVKTNNDYPGGLKQLRQFLNEFQDYPEFESRRPFVAETARIIALDSASLAGRTKNEELLRTSDEARGVFSSFAAKEVQPAELVAQIEKAKRQSQADILKYRVATGATESITSALKANDTLKAVTEWRNLVSRYAELRPDAKTMGLLRQILDAERARVTVEQLDVAAATDERPSDTDRPVSLVFHARSRIDEVSGGRAIPAVVKDCCYGIDTITGQPVWRRVIGLDVPFYPVIDAGSGAVLLFDTRSQELLKVDVNSGKLGWRVAIGERAAAAPLVVNGRILLPTDQGRVYGVGLADGAVQQRTSFSQPLSSLVLLPGEERVLVAGDREVFYTLNATTLECERVDYAGDGHPSGSIRAPLLAMGPYLLVCENSATANNCRMLLFRRGASGDFETAASATLAGLVVDPPVIRGQDLFVASTGQRVNTFTVSDVTGQPVLTTGPQYPGEAGRDAPIFLSAGPERQVWLASDAVRRLQVTGDKVVADQTIAAVGLATQPLQYVDRRLFSFRRRPFADAVTVTRMDRDTLVGDTQTVIGAGVLAATSFADDPNSLVVATGAGNVFRVQKPQWTVGGVVNDATDRLPLHEDLAEPLVAGPLDKGQLAVACGGPEPKLWVINRVGKVDRFVPLTYPPQGPPSLMGGWVLLPTAGRLKLAAVTQGQSQIEDFTLPTDEAATAEWRYVRSVSDNDAVAVLAKGDVLLVRHETSPRHYLNAVAKASLGARVLFRGDADQGLLAVADDANVVHLFETSGLAVRGERTLAGTISNDVWLAGGSLLVEVDHQRLVCLAAAGELPEKWTLPLDGASVAGRPLAVDGDLVIPLHDGRVLYVNGADGEVRKTVQTGQTLAGSPLAIGGDLLATTFDGSLVKLPAAAEPSTR